MCFKEQICLKFCVTLTFSYKFWLKCFQLQNCSLPWDLSNDRSQAYIKRTCDGYDWKKFGTWLFPRELGPFLGETTLIFGETTLLSKELGPFLKNNTLFPWETILLPKELFFLLVQVIFLKYFIYSLANFFVLLKLHFTPWGTYIVP